MVRAAPTLTDVQHSKLCYSKDRYCGHPRQCGIYNFGNGEIAVMHHHARSTYRTLDDIRHGWDDIGYKRRCQIVLQRSRDYGRDVAERERRGGLELQPPVGRATRALVASRRPESVRARRLI